DALAPVAGGGGGSPGGVFDVEPGFQRDAPAVPQGALGRPHGDRGVGGDLRGELAGGGGGLAGRDPAVDQAEPLGLVDADLAPGQHQVGGPAGAEPAQRQLGAAASGHQPHRHLGQPEDGGLVGHYQVAGQGQLE